MSQSSREPAGRIIVLFSRSWPALTCIRSLGQHGVEVIAADEFGVTPGSLSKYCTEHFEYPSPAGDEHGFIAALDEAIERFHPGDDRPYVLLPVQLETAIVARHAERWRGKIAIAAPPSALIDQVSDKGWLAQFAEQHNVVIPPTWYPEDRAALDAVLDDITLPAVVKIRSGIGGSGLQMCNSTQEITSAFDALIAEYQLDSNSAPIIQQVVAGDDYCVCTMGHHGAAVGTMTYRNLRHLPDGGPGVLRETVAAAPAEAATRTLIKALDWHGIAQFDFMWDGIGQAFLIELNARLFGGLFQALASGVDYPWLLYCQAAGLPLPPAPEGIIGVVTETPILSMVATVQELAEALSPGDRLSEAWDVARAAYSDGDLGSAANAWLDRLTSTDDAQDPIARLQGLLELNEDAISQAMLDDDPKAILGLIYPMVAFVKYGRVNRNILMGLEAP